MGVAAPLNMHAYDAPKSFWIENLENLNEMWERAKNAYSSFCIAYSQNRQ